MTDAQISRALALAIGYRPEDIGYFDPPHDMRVVVPFGNGWRLFSYTSPSVIWRVAERFDCFPSKWDEDGPEAWVACCEMSLQVVRADTAAKAVALAVIRANGGGHD